MKIKIGTRGSKLALAQTNYVLNKLQSRYPDNEYEIVVIKTTGDNDLTKPLDAIGSKGLFVDTIEAALLKDEIQLAVHSMKDMPENPLEGLIFSESWEREDPRDVLILNDGNSYKDIPLNGTVATGSKRRSFQLLKLRPDLNIVPIRGNIDTRLRKLKEGLSDGTKLDGIILAAAGLNRLNITPEHIYYFSPEEMIPAPAQGTLALELHDNNKELLDMVNSFADEQNKYITYLERGFLKAIGGDCHLPIAAHATYDNGEYKLSALFGEEDGNNLAFANEAGEEANQELIDRTVKNINDKLKGNN